MPEKPIYFWEADVELEVRNIAFSLQSNRERREGKDFQFLRSPWIEVEDGIVFWNPAQRFKGWVKEQIGGFKTTYLEPIKQGIKVYPKDGEDKVKIGEVKDLVGASKMLQTAKGEYRVDPGMPIPFGKFIAPKREGQAVPIFWYILPGPIEVELRIISFARNIRPGLIKGAAEKLGEKVGMGDMARHGAFGLFKVREFKCNEEELKF